MEKISFVILKAFLFSLVSLLMTFYSTAIFAKTDSPLSILPNHCHFTSNIKQTKNVEGLPVPLISSGQIFFHCKHGLIWQTIEPVKELLIFSGKYYQFKENGPNSLERLNTQESSFLSNLLQGIMGADQSYIEESFSIQKFLAHLSNLFQRIQFYKTLLRISPLMFCLDKIY